MLEKHLLTEPIGMLIVCTVSPMIIDREGDKEMHSALLIDNPSITFIWFEVINFWISNEV